MNTDWTEFPVCPHCGESDQDWWDGLEVSVEDGTEWDANCAWCSQDYKVTACVTLTFTTKKETEDGN